jgi:eukaryotic-like serine/threonine-protein kinase
VVDQLEEIFAGGVTDKQRIAFARLLTSLTDSKRIWIAATLRADLYGRMLDPTSPFLALKDAGGHYDLASPGQAELTEILQKSAEAAGLVYEKDRASGETLDDQLLHDAAGSDTLPLLEFTLEKLFEEKRIVETELGQRAQLPSQGP